MKKYEVTMYEVMAIKLYVEADSKQDAICKAVDINNDGCYEDGTEMAEGVYHRTSDDIHVREFEWVSVEHPYGEDE